MAKVKIRNLKNQSFVPLGISGKAYNIGPKESMELDEAEANSPEFKGLFATGQLVKRSISPSKAKPAPKSEKPEAEAKAPETKKEPDDKKSGKKDSGKESR